MSNNNGLLQKAIEASLSQTDASKHLADEVRGKMGEIDQKVAEAENTVQEYIQGAAQHMPVAPNILKDTKKFEQLCGGELNKPHDILSSHSGCWSAAINGSYDGTLTVLTKDKVDEYGVNLDGDLKKACPRTNPNDPFGYGHDFNVVLIDVAFTSPSVGDQPNILYLLQNHGCSRFTGWEAGEFLTQSCVFVNVLSVTGDLTFYAQDNMSARISAGAGDVGKGWIMKTASQKGWGGCHQPTIRGKIGTMKVAMALPYVGSGWHQGNYIWAGNIGARYSHYDV